MSGPDLNEGGGASGSGPAWLPANGLGQTYILEPPEARLLREEALQCLRAPMLWVDAAARIRQGVEHTNAATVFRHELDELVAGRPYPIAGPPRAAITPRAERVARALEFDFLWDPDASSLDLLGGLDADQLARTSRLPTDPVERALTYRGLGTGSFRITWKDADFPGGPPGDNEWAASLMSTDLKVLRPERRVNSTADALCTRARYPSIARDIEDNCRLIPEANRPSPSLTPRPSSTHPSGFLIDNGSARAFLLENALQAFNVTAAAALREYNVSLIVGSGYRTSDVAKRNAEASGNSRAVASFSAHMLGLAFDLHLTYSDLEGTKRRFAETTTRPFTNVVNMRTSPAHKFLFAFGDQFGWFPYQVEPWHWEYNPEGFSEAFPSGDWSVTDPFVPPPSNPFDP